MNKFIEFILKLFHIKRQPKKLATTTGFNPKENEYESWLGI